MITLETLIQIIGWLFVPLGCAHIAFPKYFDWKKDLADLQLINRQMMEVHTFFIGLIVFLIGLLCITSSRELIETSFGRRLSLGLAIFWGARLLVQFFWYSPKLWRGKKFETAVHIAFSLFWAAITAVFGMASASA
ncbi:MAG: hypothetical protein AAF585_11945 [Verrucomicrobiota bacterium]